MFKEITIRDCFLVLFENIEGGKKIENINIFSLLAKKQMLKLISSSIASPEMWA